MHIPFINLEFFYEGKAVGVFIHFKYPTKNGQYRYEPYRGMGHYKMRQSIRETGIAVCSYINGNKKVFFDVEDAGKYGKLILSEFSKEVIQN